LPLKCNVHCYSGVVAGYRTVRAEGLGGVRDVPGAVVGLRIILKSS
jgi:hypothetical protein